MSEAACILAPPQPESRSLFTAVNRRMYGIVSLIEEAMELYAKALKDLQRRGPSTGEGVSA